MRLIFSWFFLCSVSLLSACHHFDPMDTVRQEKVINIAVINSDTYGLIPNAHCTIRTDTSDEAVDTQLNPDAILLAADYKTLSLDCTASGYKQDSIAITNTISRWSASDLFMLPPGDIVDTTSSLLPYYPSHVLVLMNKKPFIAPEATEKSYQHAKEKNQLYQGTVA